MRRVQSFAVLVLACAFGQGCVSCADWQRSRPYFCAPDAATPLDVEDPQCGLGWRCGLDERCHPIGKPAPYDCRTDDDCEAGWRCGPEKKCVDVAAEALKANAFAGALRASIVSPRVNLSAADQVATASFAVSQVCGPPAPAVSLAFVNDAGTVRSTRYPLGRRLASDGGGPLDCDAGTGFETVFSAVGTGAPMTRPAVGLTDTSRATWVLGAGGQLCRFGVDDAALLGCEGIKLDFAATAVRSGRSPDTAVVARSSSRYVVLTPDGRVSVARRVAPSGVEQQLDDVLPTALPDGGTALVAATPTGLFIAEVPVTDADAGSASAPADEAWAPAGVPGVSCPGAPPGPNAIGTLRWLGWASGADVLTGIARGADGDDHAVVFGGTPAASAGMCTLPRFDGVDHRSPMSCPACLGERLESFTATAVEETRFALELRCRSTAGALSVWVALLDTSGCAPERVTSSAPLPQVVATGGPSTSASAGASGQLWVSTGAGFSREARFLDRTPSLVLGDPQTLTVGAAAVPVMLPSGTIELLAPQLFELREGQGLVSRTGGADLLAAVEGAGRWAVRDAVDGGSLLPPTVVALEPDGTRRLLAKFTTSETFKPPYHAASAPRADGGTVLVVSAFDALLATELEPSAHVDLATAPVLRVRLVPLNRSEITALTVLPRDGQARYVEGWLLSAGRLHRFFADSPTVWKSDELPLPPGDPLTVFHDGPRGRVAYTDGRIFSLPGRVEIAPALPVEDQPAADFVDVCGQVLSVGKTRAFRLVAEGTSSVGTWQPIALPAGKGAPTQLHATPDGAFVFFDDGRVVRLEGLVCL